MDRHREAWRRAAADALLLGAALVEAALGSFCWKPQAAPWCGASGTGAGSKEMGPVRNTGYEFLRTAHKLVPSSSEGDV